MPEIPRQEPSFTNFHAKKCLSNNFKDWKNCIEGRTS